MKRRAGVTDKIEDKNVPVNVPNLAAMLGVSEKTIKRDIAAMQSAGLIKRVRSDKTGHWEVVEPTERTIPYSRAKLLLHSSLTTGSEPVESLPEVLTEPALA